jgi:hypothetical protein
LLLLLLLLLLVLLLLLEPVGWFRCRPLILLWRLRRLLLV